MGFLSIRCATCTNYNKEKNDIFELILSSSIF